MRFVALCSLLLVAGCGSSRVAPLAPDPTLRVRVEIAAQDYPAGASIVATITNESSFPILLAHVCAPGIETTDGDMWTTVQLILVCTLDARPPQELAPGATTSRYIQTRHATGEALPPGTYRAVFHVSPPEWSFSALHSPEFMLE